MAACFAPKGLWYAQSSRSTPASSVQTVRRQTAHFQFHSDAPHPHAHGHELDHRGFQQGRQRRCDLDEGGFFEQGCQRWCLTSQVGRRRPPRNVGSESDVGH